MVRRIASLIGVLFVSPPAFSQQRMVRLIAGVVALLLARAHVSAQERIFALVQSSRFWAELWEARVESGQIVDVRNRTTAGGLGGGPVVTGGGQFVVWGAFYALGLPPGLVAFDRIAGASYSLLPSAGTSTLSLPVADPTRARVFLSDDNTVLSLTPAGTTSLPGTAGLEPVAISPDGSRLYATRVANGGPPASYDLVILDADTGAEIGAFPIGAAPQGVTPAADHESVWVISSRPAAPADALLRRFDIPSGQEQFAVPLPAAPEPMTTSRLLVGVDEDRERVVVQVIHTTSVPGDESGALETYLSTNGAAVSRVELPGWVNAGLDLGAGRVLALSQDLGSTRFATLSTATGQLVTSTNLGPAAPLYHSVAFATPPRPPALNPPTVSPSRAVSLSWSRAPEMTIGFTVEAGSGPGLTNLAMLPVTSGNTLSVSNVPPGTYYVRVKAWNYIGASVPSNEVVVTVP